MAENKSGSQVFTPGKGDGMSVRHVHTTEGDRKKHNKEFREQKAHEQKVKEERFAAIQERRRNRNSGGSGGGINITVDTDKK